MGKISGFEKEEKKKRKWSDGEDQILKDYVKKHGPGKWGKIAKEIGKFIISFINIYFRHTAL